MAQLFDAVLTVTGELDLERVLASVIEAARDLIGVRYAALGVLTEDGDGLAAFVHTGMSEAQVAAIGRLPRGLGLLGAVVHEPQALRVDDLAHDPRAIGLPPGHPPMQDFLGAPIRVGDRVYGNVYLSERRDGAPFTHDDEELLVGLAAVAGTAIASARQVGELRARESFRDGVATITTAVLAGQPSRTVRELVVGVVRDLLAADGVAMVAERHGHVEVVASVGAAPAVGPVEVASPADLVLHTGVTRRLVAGVLFPEHHVLWVPLSERGRVNAALGAARSTPFARGDVGLTEDFADQASLALAHDRDTRELQRLRLMEERERIGRDLHDTVIQRLFATGLSLQAVAGHGAPATQVRDRIGRAVDDIDRTVREIRTTIFSLQPNAAPAGLRSAVLEVIDEVAPMLARTPRLRFDGPLDTEVDAVVAQEVVPTVREALTNVAKHADASNVEVELTAASDVVRVRIRDDGVGRDTGGRSAGTEPAAAGTGRGLRNLRRRALACGGGLTITEPAGGGTELTWWAPLHGRPTG